VVRNSISDNNRQDKHPIFRDKKPTEQESQTKVGKTYDAVKNTVSGDQERVQLKGER
jgi:hypothetical protein